MVAYPAFSRRSNKHLLEAKQRLEVKRRLAIAVSARRTVKSIDLNEDHSRLLCAIFFWCEGGKDTRSGIRFMNSDPAMIRTFLHLLRSSFKIEESRLRALIHLHQYHDPQKQLSFWSKITDIPPHQFHRPYLKMNTGKNLRPNYPGCVSIRYNDSSLGKLLEMIYIEFSNSLLKGHSSTARIRLSKSLDRGSIPRAPANILTI